MCAGCGHLGRKHTPIVSGAQQRLMGIAEHNPGKVYSRNKSILGMSHTELSRHLHESKGKKFPYRVKGK